MPSIGLVLGGGGARGAYEAGVLRHIADHVPPCADRRGHFDVVVGTSAGAINGAWMAAQATEPGHRAHQLATMWEGLEFEQVFRVRTRDLLRLPRGLLGLGGDVALVDTSPLRRMVRERIPWPAIDGALASGDLRAFAVTATELATSRNIVFIHGRDVDVRVWDSPNPYIRPRPAVIGPEHILASAAIPLLFPPVQVGDRFFVDGGLGQQTPLRPALRLGVDRVLVISLRKNLAVGEGEEVACCRSGEPPTWAQVLGKTMNSVLLDTAGHEVERVHRWNRMLDWGEREFGPGYGEQIAAFLASERGAPTRRVEPLLISPSVDLGEMALRHVRSRDLSPTGLLIRLAVRGLARSGSSSENDALSYLLFDRGFLAEILALGERDAAAHHDQLVELFAGG